MTIQISTVQKKISNLLENHGCLNLYHEDAGFNYFEDGDLDSFEILSFIADVEATFSIGVAPNELENPAVHTIGGLAELIVAKTAGVR